MMGKIKEMIYVIVPYACKYNLFHLLCPQPLLRTWGSHLEAGSHKGPDPSLEVLGIHRLQRVVWFESVLFQWTRTPPGCEGLPQGMHRPWSSSWSFFSTFCSIPVDVASFPHDSWIYSSYFFVKLFLLIPVPFAWILMAFLHLTSSFFLGSHWTSLPLSQVSVWASTQCWNSLEQMQYFLQNGLEVPWRSILALLKPKFLCQVTVALILNTINYSMRQQVFT